MIRIKAESNQPISCHAISICEHHRGYAMHPACVTLCCSLLPGGLLRSTCHRLKADSRGPIGYGTSIPAHNLKRGLAVDRCPAGFAGFPSSGTPAERSASRWCRLRRRLQRRRAHRRHPDAIRADEGHDDGADKLVVQNLIAAQHEEETDVGARSRSVKELVPSGAVTR